MRRPLAIYLDAQGLRGEITRLTIINERVMVGDYPAWSTATDVRDTLERSLPEGWPVLAFENDPDVVDCQMIVPGGLAALRGE